MSASGENRVETGTALVDLPTYALDYEFDDPVEPTTVTVYEPSLVVRPLGPDRRDPGDRDR